MISNWDAAYETANKLNDTMISNWDQAVIDVAAATVTTNKIKDSMITDIRKLTANDETANK